MTTEARLRSLATALGSGSPEEVLLAWQAQWRLPHVKELYRSHEKEVKAIVTFAKDKATGDLTGGEEGYREMVGKVIASVGRVA